MNLSMIKMNDKINKTSICSIQFLDIVDYSKKSVSEQIEVKSQFNALINQSLKNIAESDRIILDTGDGAAIAHSGSPEEALFVSLTIRDEILKNNIHSATPLYVRFGINLGPVRMVSDINGQPNLIGDGINVAERVMSFAKPNQILVSRSYFEVTSRLTQEISQMFDYSGNKSDKHGRQHEVYSVRLLKENTVPETAIEATEKPTFWQTEQYYLAAVNWKYVLLALPAILAFGLIIKMAAQPVNPTITMQDPIPQQSPVAAGNLKLKPATNAINPTIPSQIILLPNETVENAATLALTKDSAINIDSANDNLPEKTLAQKLADEEKEKAALAKVAIAQKKAKKKADAALQAELSAKPVAEPGATDMAQNPVSQASQAKTVETTKTADVKEKKDQDSKSQDKPKSGWKSFTEGLKNDQQKQCTQAQIAMNNCH